MQGYATDPPNSDGIYPSRAVRLHDVTVPELVSCFFQQPWTTPPKIHNYKSSHPQRLQEKYKLSNI